MSGVGAGASKAHRAFHFPGAAVNVQGQVERIYFDAPIVDDSQIPPLWGLRSLRANRALIDCQGLKLHLLGPGDLRLNLPPGSRSFPLELSDGGHLILPIGEFEKMRQQEKTSDKSSKTLSFAAQPEVHVYDEETVRPSTSTSSTSTATSRTTLVTVGTQTDDNNDDGGWRQKRIARSPSNDGR